MKLIHEGRMKKIRIVLVDDHEVVRRGLFLLLNLEADMEVIGEAASGLQAIEQVKALAPDVVLMDVRMPGMSGPQAARAIKQIAPRTRVLIVSGVEKGEEIVAALESDVDGYVLKDAPPSELIQAIQVVAGGQAYLQPAVAKQLLRRMAATANPQSAALPPTLTQRELEVLKLMSTNRSTKEIAAELIVGEETVRSHIKRVLQKLDQPNRTQAVLAALRLGLIQLDELRS